MSAAMPHISEKASDCFLVRMKNGDKYVIGCADSSEMVNYIKRQIG